MAIADRWMSQPICVRQNGFGSARRRGADSCQRIVSGPHISAVEQEPRRSGRDTDDLISLYRTPSNHFHFQREFDLIASNQCYRAKAEISCLLQLGIAYMRFPSFACHETASPSLLCARFPLPHSNKRRKEYIQKWINVLAFGLRILPFEDLRKEEALSLQTVMHMQTIRVTVVPLFPVSASSIRPVIG